MTYRMRPSRAASVCCPVTAGPASDGHDDVIANQSDVGSSPHAPGTRKRSKPIALSWLTGALAAISADPVPFGGLTRLGNAFNLMVRAIAAHCGVRMPGFLTYPA
jgi:Putative citrate transport